MNRSCVILMLNLLAASGALAGFSEIERARVEGAKGRVTLRVVDSKGVPVEGAEVRAGFYHPRQRGGSSEGLTDSNGLFTATGRPVEDVNYSITKTGYYDTIGTYVFYHPGVETVLVSGCWQPWNPTNTVVLKEHRNPVPMYAGRLEITVPVRDTPVGFDLECFDWVVPYGKGATSDVFITYSSLVQDSWNFSNQLVIACRNKMDGLIRKNKDQWSAFWSMYEAPVDSYIPQVAVTFATTIEKTLRSEKIDDSEYVIFRVRTTVDDKGNIVSARYGKMYGPIQCGEMDSKLGGARLDCYFNPDGTPNLEYDPTRNLMQWRFDAPQRVSSP